MIYIFITIHFSMISNLSDHCFAHQLLARRQIDMLTAHAWLLESKELEDKVNHFSGFKDDIVIDKSDFQILEQLIATEHYLI